MAISDAPHPTHHPPFSLFTQMDTPYANHQKYRRFSALQNV